MEKKTDSRHKGIQSPSTRPAAQTKEEAELEMFLAIVGTKPNDMPSLDFDDDDDDFDWDDDDCCCDC